MSNAGRRAKRPIAIKVTWAVGGRGQSRVGMTCDNLAFALPPPPMPIWASVDLPLLALPFDTKGIHLSIHPSLRLCLFIHASIRPSILHPSCRSINTSVHLSVNSSINHPSFHPACLSVHPPSIHASVCPFFILNPSIHLQNKTGVSDGWLVYI